MKDELPFGHLNISTLLKQQIEKQMRKFKAKAESSVSTFSFLTFVTVSQPNCCFHLELLIK